MGISPVPPSPVLLAAIAQYPGGGDPSVLDANYPPN